MTLFSILIQRVQCLCDDSDIKRIIPVTQTTNGDIQMKEEKQEIKRQSGVVYVKWKEARWFRLP